MTAAAAPNAPPPAPICFRFSLDSAFANSTSHPGSRVLWYESLYDLAERMVGATDRLSVTETSSA
jgi:hypothetical protein